jgi:hypothetical protein
VCVYIHTAVKLLLCVYTYNTHTCHMNQWMGGGMMRIREPYSTSSLSRVQTSKRRLHFMSTEYVSICTFALVKQVNFAFVLVTQVN